jgi:hypothetical protein
MINDYINGYIERKNGGKVDGQFMIEGINLSPIQGVFFKEDDKNYLWLRRKEILVYDERETKYIKRKPKPQWEAYLEKHVVNNTTIYKGHFYFMRFVYSIVGMWDNVNGKDNNRMNFFVDRLPDSQQKLVQKDYEN